MSKTPASTRLRLRLCAVLVTSGLVTTPARAVPDPTGPFFSPAALRRPSYELSVESSFAFATRDDFRRRVFLFQPALARVRALSLTTRLELRLGITRGLALQAVLPVVATWARVKTAGVVVSRDERLPGRTRRLSGVGLGDPLLALGYRFTAFDPLRLYVDAGTTTPLADNPGSNVFPTRIPLSTGQTQLFASAGAHAALAPWSLALDYRFSFFPGSTAAYLIRVVGNQSYTSGSLEPFTRHRATALVRYQLDDWLAAGLSPQWTVTEMPLLADEDGAIGLVPEPWMHELHIKASARFTLHPHHTLELFYRQPFIRSWDIDPFFPIVLPERGFGVAWHAHSW